ncbi:hypothetical protein NEAUS03_1342 [Nematocida ausubeli]|nr:hypothetical protein NEAUS03_1342 [Nematocida ausubeli]
MTKKTKNKMLTILLYVKKRASLYPGIEMLCQTDNPHDINTAEHYNIFDYLLSYENPGLLMEFLLAYMELPCSCSFQANPLRVPVLGRRIFKCLFADRSISRLEQLEAQMGAYWRECVVGCTWVNLSWLVYACEEGRAADEFIRVILRHIKRVSALRVEDSNILAYSYNISVGNLMSMKDALVPEGNEKLERKFYKIVRVLNAISTYCPEA